MPLVDKSLFFSQRIDSFLIFCETSSIKETARRLGISGSAVSRQLSSLEKDLGIDLIDRSSHPLVLTADGKFFAAKLNEQFLQLHGALGDIQQRNFRLPTLNIGFLQTLSTTVASDFVKKIKKDVGPILCLTGTSSSLLHQLEERRLDLIVVSRRYEQLKNMRVQPLFTEPMVLTLPKKVARNYQNWTWDRLRFCGLSYIRFYRDSGGKEQEDFLRTIGLQFPNVIESDNTGLIMSLVAQNKGWSMVRPSALLPFDRILPNLQLVPLPSGSFSRHIYLIAHESFSEQHFKLVHGVLTSVFRNNVIPKLLKFAPWLEKLVYADDSLDK